jgi:PncC family amidohydrolase
MANGQPDGVSDGLRPALEEMARLLLEKGLTVAVAESSIGGYLSHLITMLPGASKTYRGGVVAYDNRLKTQVLKVPQVVIDHEGAVSAQTALVMASGVRVLCDADIGLSETGIAGPGGGDGLKPAGTVFMAIVARDGYQLAERSRWQTDRAGFKERTAEGMLDLALHYLRRESPVPPGGECPPEAF